MAGPFQQQFNGYVAYKKQSAKDTPASGSGASILPLTGGAGKLTKSVFGSQQVRRDGMRVRGRHGVQATAGQYPGELQMSNYDEIIQAVMRASSWSAGSAITQATSGMSSATISVSGNTVTASGGSFITAGGKMFDTHVWTAGLAAADLNKPLQVVGMTATSITYAQPLTTVAGPVATWSFSPKGHSLINPQAPVEAYYTIEEYNVDIDQSVVFYNCKWTGFDLGLQPDNMVTITPKWTGDGNVLPEATGASPYFTTPSLPLASATPLAAIDCGLYVSDVGLVTDLTALTLGVDLNATAPKVAASKVSPDVFCGQMGIDGSMTKLLDSLTQFQDFLNETQLFLHLLASVPGSSPTDFMSFALPNFTFGGHDPSEFKIEGGPRTQTLAFPNSVVGLDARGGAYDLTMLKVQRST